MHGTRDAYGHFIRKITAYTQTEKAQIWLIRNRLRIKTLFSNVSLRDFVFEPFKGVFAAEGNDAPTAIRQTITTVALANMVLAGLPGKLGVGVFVSMALEGYMAYTIASKVGVSLQTPADVWKYFGLLAGIIGAILYLFRAMLGVAFSLFAPIPGLPATAMAELLVTNLVGILFWVGFEEAKLSGSFRVPKRALTRIGQEFRDLTRLQVEIVRRNLTPNALWRTYHKLKAWLLGEVPADQPLLRGQIAPAVLMAALLSGQQDRLQGPLGQEFVAAIRDRFPELRDASLDEIAAHMREYTPEQMAGVLSLIKGKLFERLVARYENADGDSWRAVLHTDESYPGSDIVFIDEETGRSLEVSLKATDDPSYVEAALLKYPDIPILTTEEVSHFFGNDPRVWGATLSNEELTQITSENFEELLSRLTNVDVAASAASGVATGGMLSLWPFVVAFLRGRITHEQLEQACTRVAGEAGIALAARLSYALLFGPMFAWYLLARGVMGLSKAAQKQATAKSTMRIEWVGNEKRSFQQHT
jgi:hypothetical protein